MLEDRDAAVVLKVFIQAHAVAAFPQDAGQRRLANLDRLAAQVRAIQLQQVKGVQERLGLVLSPAEHMEPRYTSLVAAHKPHRRLGMTAP
jgi:hypothetical protein